MLANGIRPTVFYCNPNIYPPEEYEIRKQEAIRFVTSQGLDFVDADYDHTLWQNQMKGLEEEPERGRRCLRCFLMRLDETATNIVSSLQAEMERGTVKRIPFQYIFFTFYALLTFPFAMKNLCSSIFLSEKENFNEMLENWKPYIVEQMCHLLETHGKAAFNNDMYLSAG